jgi:hypothetical protein
MLDADRPRAPFAQEVFDRGCRGRTIVRSQTGRLVHEEDGRLTKRRGVKGSKAVDRLR